MNNTINADTNIIGRVERIECDLRNCNNKHESNNQSMIKLLNDMKEAIIKINSDISYMKEELKELSSDKKSRKELYSMRNWQLWFLIITVLFTFFANVFLNVIKYFAGS